MFGIVIYFGIFLSIPILLCSVFLYPHIKTKLFIKKLSPLLFFLQSFSIYSILSLLYLLAAAKTPINIDDVSILIFILGIFFYQIARKLLPSPKSLILFILPETIISAIHFLYWIRYGVVYGLEGSIGWVSYSLNAIPFGAAFSGLLNHPYLGYLHLITVLFPVACSFLGGGIRDYFDEKGNKTNLSNKR